MYAVSGKKDEAKRTLELLAREGTTRKDLTYGVALIQTELGNADEAFKWLGRAYEDRPGALGMIKVDPKLDTLRADQRFEQLLKRLKLDGK